MQHTLAASPGIVQFDTPVAHIESVIEGVGKLQRLGNAACCFLEEADAGKQTWPATHPQLHPSRRCLCAGLYTHKIVSVDG